MKTKVKLSARFYLLSIVVGIIVGLIFSFPVAEILAKHKANSMINLTDYQDDSGHINYLVYDEARYVAQKEAKSSFIVYLVIIFGVISFPILFILIGRMRHPVKIDNQGIEVWHWFGTKRHLWTDFQDKKTVHLKSSRAKLASFEQFRFSTGTVSVYTRRLVNGNDVLNQINELLLG